MEPIEWDYLPIPDRYIEGIVGVRHDWPWRVDGKRVWLMCEESEPDEQDCN